MANQKDHSIAIIGSGPAGLTAAIYAARAELKPTVFAGASPGGQLMLTSEIENFPGFAEPITGPNLMKAMREQAKKVGTEILDVDVKSANFSKTPFKIKAGDKDFSFDSIIIATGASARWLGLETEQSMIGRGVSSCATCDGFFFKGREVVVVGGGDAALEEALFLTKFATKVTILHRRDQLRASKIMQKRAKDNPKIDFVWDVEVVKVLGKEKVTGVRLKNTKTGNERNFKTDAMFVAIGHKPNTEFIKDHVDLDKKGYVKVKDGTRTSKDGVFVAGDVQDFRYRQAITAAGFGAMASIDAEKWLAESGKIKDTKPTSSYGR